MEKITFCLHGYGKQVWRCSFCDFRNGFMAMGLRLCKRLARHYAKERRGQEKAARRGPD